MSAQAVSMHKERVPEGVLEGGQGTYKEEIPS